MPPPAAPFLIAVAGAGKMARSRGRAFLETGRARICAVAARRLASARDCAAELGCDRYFDDYRRLVEAGPDALLIEVPHQAQDEIAVWSLETGFDVLVGGCLASSVEAGARIVELTEHGKRTVEIGYQRRYDPAWEGIHRSIGAGDFGEPVMAVSMALWRPDPRSWYYDQASSGGMPLTHLSYCFLNAIRWILGRPTAVAAMANRKVETAPGRVCEETCGALIEFDNGAFLSATASYAGTEGMGDADTRFVCADGAIQVNRDSAPGTTSITLFGGGTSDIRVFDNEPSPVVHQANAFLDALEGGKPALNPPADALVDVQIAAAISASVRERRTIALGAER